MPRIQEFIVSTSLLLQVGESTHRRRINSQTTNKQTTPQPHKYIGKR